MIYKLTKNDIFKDNPDLDLVPEFSNCTDRQLKFLFLSADYESPLRKLDFTEKMDKALEWSGYRKEKSGQWDKNARLARDGKTKSIEAARHVFMAIQNDSDKYLLFAVRQQIKEILDFLTKSDKSASQIEKGTKFVKELPELKKTEKQLIELLQIEEENLTKKEEDDIVDNMSLLDRINQEEQDD